MQTVLVVILAVNALVFFDRAIQGGLRNVRVTSLALALANIAALLII